METRNKRNLKYNFNEKLLFYETKLSAPVISHHSQEIAEKNITFSRFKCIIGIREKYQD